MEGISLVIATHKREEKLKSFLRTLDQCMIPECTLNIFVIENGYKGYAKELCDKSCKSLLINYLYLDRPGQAYARRFAIEKIDKDDLVIFFDDDVKLEKQILVEYFKFAKKYGKGFFYGGPVYPDYEVEPPKQFIELFPYSVKGFYPFSSVTIQDRPVFIGSNWAAFASDIIEAGNFNASLGPGGSMKSTGHETEMQERLLRKGSRGVYLPEAQVRHFVPKSALKYGWLKYRYYKMGRTAGSQLNEVESGNTLYKVPKWLLKDFFISFIKFPFYTFYNNKSTVSLRERLLFYKNLGMMSYFFRK